MVSGIMDFYIKCKGLKYVNITLNNNKIIRT